jgi:hypothetical protein
VHDKVLSVKSLLIYFDFNDILNRLECHDRGGVPYGSYYAKKKIQIKGEFSL